MFLAVFLLRMHFPQSTRRMVNMTLSRVYALLSLPNGPGARPFHPNGRGNPS